MKKTLAGRVPSPAMTVALLALFVALGGTSYAAFGLPRNSVGTKQLKNGAVTNQKIKAGAVGASQIANGAITGSKLKLSALGPVPLAQNAGHASTADTATNAGNANNAANTAELGGAPASAYQQFGSTLPSGMTETGPWSAAGYEGGSYAATDISFRPPFAAPLDGNHTIYVSASSATHCPGVGRADPGYLCVYQQQNQNMDFNSFDSGGSSGAGTDGTSLFLSVATTVFSFADGHWALTAP